MAALFTLLLGAASLLLGYFLYDFGRQNFVRETEAAIDSEIEHMLVLSRESTADTFTKHLKERSEQSDNPIYLYQTADGKKLAGNTDKMPADVELIKEGVIQFDIRRFDTERIFAAKVHTFSDGSTLLIARDIHEIIQSYEKLKLFSALIMIFMLIVVLVSFFISFFVVGRINIIAQTAKQIMETGDLSRRISIDTKWDDLSDLAQTLNALLNQIESLMQGIRDVSDNIAHDLRTPLTRLRHQLEEAKNAPPEEHDINALLAEADHLLATFNALLRISNIEKGKRHQAFAPVDLQVVLRDVIELYEPLAEEKNIALEASYQQVPTLSGDRDLLFQLFANLIDNAIKFAPKTSAVTIAIFSTDGNPHIVIADQGVGVAASEREKVFDRFYRADKSRHTVGNGLGLSLVKAVAELHHGSITLSDNDPGLKIDITFSHYQ